MTRPVEIRVQGVLAWCEVCRGTRFLVEKRGLSLIKGLAGYFLHGLPGTALSLSGSSDVIVECVRCHAKWRMK